jgi:hypothetical protein
MATRIQLRRDTAANWAATNPTLASGEWGYDTTSGDLKVGDGVTAWNALDFFLPSGVDLAQQAVKLQTARTLWGNSFDGTANITAQIADSFLATITTAGKVANSATTAAAANTASAIVARDSNGDFIARNITATLFNGPATSAQSVAVADVTGLLSGGKILSSLLPGIALVSTSVVASQAAMLALSVETGDVAVRTDVNKTFILAGTDPTNIAHWQELLTPTDAVTSVAGRTGVVTLVSADITDATSAATASRIVIRDGSGGFAAVAISLSGALTMSATASKIVPGATSFAVRNNADTQNNLIVTDAGILTVRAGLTLSAGTLTLTGTTVAGAPTWSSSQAITLSTAAQPNVTSLGTLTGLDLNGDLNFVSANNISNAGTISAGGTVTLTATGTSVAASGDVTIATSKKLALNAGKTTYLLESSSSVQMVANSVNIANFGTLAGNSSNEFLCQLWDVSAPGLKTLKRGAADSGGSGKRLVVVDN